MPISGSAHVIIVSSDGNHMILSAGDERIDGHMQFVTLTSLPLVDVVVGDAMYE